MMPAPAFGKGIPKSERMTPHKSALRRNHWGFQFQFVCHLPGPIKAKTSPTMMSWHVAACRALAIPQKDSITWQQKAVELRERYPVEEV